MGYEIKGFIEGERIAKLSAVTLAALGIIEIAMGRVTGSIGLTADGIDSLSDAFVSSMVWLGLKTSRRAPDEKFHFGYYKVESFLSMVTSIVLTGIGIAILYRSYLSFLDPKPLNLPAFAAVTLLVAGTISLYRALQMRRTAKRYGLLSLDLDAKNALKDGTSSYLVLFAVLASAFGFHQMDAVGGMIVAVYIFSVSYVTLKEASLVLLDSFHSPELVQEIERLIKMAEEVKGVSDIKLRRLGPLIKSEVSIEVDGRMSVKEMYEVVKGIEESLRRGIPGMGDVVVKVIPAGANSKRD